MHSRVRKSLIDASSEHDLTMAIEAMTGFLTDWRQKMAISTASQTLVSDDRRDQEDNTMDLLVAVQLNISYTISWFSNDDDIIYGCNPSASPLERAAWFMLIGAIYNLVSFTEQNLGMVICAGISHSIQSGILDDTVRRSRALGFDPA